MLAAYSVHQHVAIGITSGLLALTTFVVYVRLYIRCVLLHVGSTEWDDLTVFIAWIMAVGASIATYFEVVSGLGRHIEELRPEQVHNLDLSSFTVMQFYNVGISAVKISFLAQYYRFFPSRFIRRVCFCFGASCFLWMFAQAVLYALSCAPIAGLVPAMADVCIPTLPTWTAISSVNAVSHLVIFCIPMKPLWGGPLLKRQRCLLIGIFSVGFIVCVISIIRIPVLRHGAASPDPSLANVATTLWSLAELDTAILCASLPILRPLAARFIRGIAPADAPADRLEAEPETGERHQALAHSWSKPGGLVVEAAPALRGTSLDDSTPKSGGSGFFRSLASGRRDRDRDRDMEELEEHRPRRAVPTTTVIEVDVPKGRYESPLDSPVGTYKKSPLTQKPVPRAPLTFYPRDSMAKRPPVPIIQPMSPRGPVGSRLPYDPVRQSSPIGHNRAQNQYQRQLYAPITAPNAPRYSSSSKMGLSYALLKPPPSLDDSSLTGTLPLAGTPSPPAKSNNTTRHHDALSPSPSPHHHHRPRVDSFTLPPPCPNHPTARQVCSRCALDRRPLPPTPVEAEETEQAPQAQQTTARVWVARSTQTVVTWGEPAVQTGEVVGGRGVHLVDVVEGDKPRSWRGQMVPTPPVDEETGSSANSRIDQRGSRGEEGERKQGLDETGVGSGVEENSPRTRQGRERVASGTTVPRRSESGRRGAGTSWLRLSTGSGRG